MEKEKKVLEALTCPNCNGEVELDKNQEFGFCKYCGTKLQNTAIKKINAKVKIDKEDEIKKLYILARRAKDNDDAEKAEKYYSRILNEVPNDWEAQFFSTYFSCKQTTIANMGSSCIKLGKTLKSVFSLIKTSDLSEAEKIEAYKTIDYNALNYYLLISNNVLSKANTYIDTCDSTFVTNFLTEHFQGMTFLLLTLGDELNKVNNLFLIGRNGQHRYNNMDHSILTGLLAADEIISGNIDKEVIWKVNTEEEYAEEKKCANN